MSTIGRVVADRRNGPVGPALKEFASDGTAGVGFCYRPADVRWFRFDTDGVPTGPDGTALDLTGVFELRAFTAAEELRWRHVSAGSGTATSVTGGDGGECGECGDGVLAEHQRLLWGTVVGPAPGPGWVALHDARIGVLPVPVDDPAPADGHLVWLRVVEYVEEDRHGNVAVVDERFTGLVARPHPSADKAEEKTDE
ncbi:CRISPR-associated protein Csx19 [Solwaraspora sp. WMMD406]|uniref:type III-D CRISPR-associated protein Csx19 n=1 Tax=Solwaraspora sp. WMMD406 TaxID=3016095 RepID=UPI0024178527|nr:CRISPR-associated protein Csx19 [Solwaraspora sp. WMMD406]MDG4765299.1 CRISPR-associated protein Csx19 [Solwaraspora sp. WMMD406]